MGVSGASGAGNNYGTTSGSCCDIGMKCWCRGRCEHHHHLLYHKFLSLILSSGFLFFMGCLVLYGFIGMFYGWLVFPKSHTPSSSIGVGLNSLGCQEDSEGSWSIGVFFGDSPFSLKPIETVSLFTFIFSKYYNIQSTL